MGATYRKDKLTEQRRMNSTILSICIATYNRALYIGETLATVISQLTTNVELIVLDGASTDHTESVVVGFAERCPQLKYVRLPEKGGFDKDYDLAVQFAVGEYCWLFTDDDLLKPNAVRCVLDQISKFRPDLIIVNADVWNSNLSVKLEERRLNLTVDKTFAPTEVVKLFSFSAVYLTFIGCVVIRRDLWMERNAASFYGSMFVHLGVIFRAPLERISVVIANPYITIRYGNAQWLPQQFEIWHEKLPTLIHSFKWLPVAERSAIVPEQIWMRPRSLLKFRAVGAYTLAIYHRTIRSTNPPLLPNLVCLAIALIPRKIATYSLKLYYLVRYPKTFGLASYDFSK